MASSQYKNLQAQSIYPYGPFLFIENYIYLHHLDKYIILPAFADSVQDGQRATFSSSSILGRSAPIYSYANSGPRTVQVNFELHRDLMKDLNIDNESLYKDVIDGNKDYVDLFIKYIQAAVLPSYEVAAKMVNPPIVSLRLGNDIFIKGVVDSGLGLTYNYPILADGRYAKVSVNLSISEINPYDAKTILNIGSYRKVSTSLERSYVITGNELSGVGDSNNRFGSVSGGLPKVNMVM